MGLFDKMKEPVFLKESSDASRQLEKLKELEPRLTDEGKKKLAQDIKMLEYGIFGEKNIAFELKNSHFPMYILHDIYLESDGLTAQIDYLVFTRKLCFIVECKNLMGDIEINANGDFIRTTEFGGKKKKEGIYSPITQNVRHMELMKKIRMDNSSNFLHKMIVGSNFESTYKTIVVLANPKTILNAKYAKKEVKNQVIRADQLVNHIKETYKESKELESSEKDFQAWAERYLSYHIEKEHDYLARYDQYLKEDVAAKPQLVTTPKPQLTYQPKQYAKPEHKPQAAGQVVIKKELIPTPPLTPVMKPQPEVVMQLEPIQKIEDTAIFKELRAFRLTRSREENIKPYFIYNDNQMKEIISKMPKNHDELRAINGFGDVKANKYGGEILGIVKMYL